MQESNARWWCEKAEPDSEGRTAFMALVTFTLILLLAPQNWFPVLAKLRLAFLAAGGAVVCFLWERWQQREYPELSREVLICLAIAAWAFITLPLSYWPGGSTSVLLDMYLKSAAIFYLLANVANTPHRLRFLAMTLAVCTVPLAVTALKNYLAGTFMAGGDPSIGRVMGYESGLGSNPNDLALMLNLVLPLAVAVFLSTTNRWIAILCVVAIAFDVMGVIVTFSRAGFLGLATIGVIYFVKLVRRPADRKWAILVLVLAVVALPLLPSNYVDRIASITDIHADPTGSAQDRWQGNVAAVRFVMQHPIVGAGIGMSILALNETLNEAGGPQWRQVHNVYLEYAVDLGLPGLILFLLLFYRVFTAARSTRRRAKSLPRDLFLIDESLEVSLTVFAVAGFFHPVAYHFYFYYIAGLALAARTATGTAIMTNKHADVRTATAWEHVVPLNVSVSTGV